MSVSAMIRNLQNFCDQVGWCMAAAAANEKNKKQVQAYIILEDGERIDLLISENERYYQLLGDRKVKEIDKKAKLQKNKESKIH
ncbi:hypothetical protein P7D58_02455 [Enterococcus avium]|uniref:hypothetical protein n=1 Tax=Enterococcus avium TaxID=33945 RepID=UPI00288F362C|nr:hypothetical protein [Enterococcus avium]MDT2392765.1 hypothetical protein [Enterococcus avium]MDT2416599.1 hypothetical protein [Enterococcus avium]MDT2429867.1 hypothetical protein [Enterococcus avium]MDT2438917.1 hypothetical protein [Enterococcus avium]MDT2451973.1 hypothetical protein [Enterococcus avium]